MIVISTNPFLLPILILIWSADLWLWLSAIRWTIGKLWPQHRLYLLLCSLTDPLPQKLSRWWPQRSGKPLAAGTAWIMTVGMVVLIRCCLMSVLIKR